MRSRRLAGHHHAWLRVRLATSLRTRWQLRWLLLPAGHRRPRGHRPPCPGGMTGTDPLPSFQSGIPGSSPPSVATSLSGSRHSNTETVLKHRGPKLAAKGRASVFLERRKRQTRKRRRVVQLMRRKASVCRGTWGDLLLWHWGRRRCTQRVGPPSSLTVLATTDLHIPSGVVQLACRQDPVVPKQGPALWGGHTLTHRLCSCVGLNCKGHVDQWVMHGRGREGLGDKEGKMLHLTNGSSPPVQGRKDVRQEARISVFPSRPLQDHKMARCEGSEAKRKVLPRNHLLTPDMSEKELTELIHEFLQDFYKKYGSFIPLDTGDVLSHLRQKVRADLNGRVALIRKEVGRYQASLTTTPPLCFTVTHNRHTLTLDDLTTLDRENWINDQVINMYGELITEAVNHKVHFFNSFFYRQLAAKGYEGVKRWTKNVDLFSKTLLLVPIHLEVHWCLVSVDLVRCAIQLYDSQGLIFKQVMENILRYIMTEAKEKNNAAFQRSWTMIVNKWIPQQKNDSDCGVFVLEYCKRLALGNLLRFSQADMPRIRKRIYKELCERKLLG